MDEKDAQYTSMAEWAAKEIVSYLDKVEKVSNTALILSIAAVAMAAATLIVVIWGGWQ